MMAGAPPSEKRRISWCIFSVRLLLGMYHCTGYDFYPRDAMLARVIAIATCLSVRPSVRPPHAGIVPSRAKARS